MAATSGDAALLFDIQVDQLARPRTLVAHDLAGRAVQLAKARDAVAAQHRVHGRVGLAQRPTDTVGTDPMGCPVVEDGLLAGG